MTLVITTGKYTLFGQIADSLATTRPHTEFEKGILHFGLFIMKTVIFLVLFVFLINIYLPHSPLESLLFAVALAVGLTPEFLPMITVVDKNGIHILITKGAPEQVIRRCTRYVIEGKQHFFEEQAR